VGYKLLIEPKIPMNDFMLMKANEIDPIMQDFKKYEITENNESSGKKLIY
jgi:hypothetical protein